MRRRTPLLAVIATVLISTVGLAPAHAAPATPVVSDVSTATPGHVTGTVTSDQPYVYVSLIPANWTEVTMAAGTGTFQLSTWGYGAGAEIYAIACSAEDPQGDCSPTPDSSTAVGFTPTDVRPDVTPLTDTTIGPGQTPSLTVSDTATGGSLHAQWVNPTGNNVDVTLDPNGTTLLSGLTDGSGTLHVVRCATSGFPCNDFAPAITQDLEVRTVTTVTVGQIAPITIAEPVATVSVATDRTGAYSLDWHLEQGGSPINGFEGSGLTGTLVNGAATFELSGIPDGDYDVAVSIAIDDPTFGTYPAASAQGYVVVDQTPPGVASIARSTATIYPRIGTTSRPASVTFTVTGDLGSQDKAEIRATPDGPVVRELVLTSGATATGSWDGRDENNALVPGGTYTFTYSDLWGNRSPVTTTVAVSTQRLVLKTFTRTVTAAGTLYDKFVGRCSTLRKPSLRGWAGSLGFYANTRCGTQTWNASAVSTLHALRLPSAERYVDLRVNTYGGAAKSRPRSRGMIRYFTTKGSTVNATMISRTLGNHTGPLRGASGMVDANRYLAWGFVAAYGDRYDVKTFTVVVRYYVLG